MLGLEEGLDAWISRFKWIYVVLLGFRWFYVDFMDSRGRKFVSLWQPVATCGLVKTGAATPLTNLCSDAGVRRRLGCLLVLEAWRLWGI